MSSLITSCFCQKYEDYKHTDCHKASPIIDIIGGVALLIIGALIASGTITAGSTALCGAFAGGAFLLGSGLSTFGQWIRNFRARPMQVM